MSNENNANERRVRRVRTPEGAQTADNANVATGVQQTNSGTVMENTTPSNAEGLSGTGQQGEEFRLIAAGSDAERNLAFDTAEKLRKYQQDVRTVNNLTVDDPMRFQQEHGYYPRRGNNSEIDEDMKGLSKQDRIDVTAGRKSLETVDEQKGIFRAVDITGNQPQQ